MNRWTREALAERGLDPDLMCEGVAWGENGREKVIVFHEAEVDRRLRILREALDGDAPAHLQQAYNELAALHFQRRVMDGG